MASEAVKKRKACNACIKAKAKCSPSSPGANVCHRCERLNKDCAYGDSLRRRGLKKRSRMKQLEQRVESLMDMLSNKDQSSSPLLKSQKPVSIHDFKSLSSYTPSKEYATPEDSASQSSTDELVAWDPIDVGLLERSEAMTMLAEFRRDVPDYFPFVIISPSITFDTLRRDQPFLFLTIMTAMAYMKPRTQRMLAQEFKEQIAARIIGCSLKGLEVAQGLLVHAAYYHFVYQTGKQQLSLIVQLCVATCQEMGGTKKRRDRDVSAAPELLAAERRTLLGSYYVAAIFAQAWRKRTTMPYTRAMGRACHMFSHQPEYPSDTLVAPLIHLSDLLCRINDQFSYDNVEDADVYGEISLEASTSNFSAELQHLRDNMPEPTKQNITVRFAVEVIDVTIYECALHNAMWQPPLSTTSPVVSYTRRHMLQRLLMASQTFARTLLEASSASLYRLTVPVWAGWFYSTLLIVKVVLLQQTGTAGASQVNLVPHAVGDFLPEENGGSATADICKITCSLAHADIGDGTTTSDEAGLLPIFQAFVEKLKAAAPQSDNESCASAATPFLMKVATLQQGLMSALKKMTERQVLSSATLKSSQRLYKQDCRFAMSTMDESTISIDQYQDHCEAQHVQQAEKPHDLPHLEEPLNFAQFDDMDPGYQPMQQPPADDWLWNMIMMEDANMFTL